MSDRDLVRRALQDAIDWQLSLADACGSEDEWGKLAIQMAKKYKALLKKRYGVTKSPMEQALDGAEVVTLEQLRQRHEAK